ncbi:ATP-dependent helicase [Duganella rhizosphaerae]|uniref:DEAD/DEAH box helicase n=1 Tax=Duganella rhizosphaerae TaxID=2885763 RepID=UPI0030E8FB84
MSQQSSSFELLDERIRRWIWSAGWEELREAQERAIPAILPGDHDVIVAAATAAGKTEAAMLPVLTHLLQLEDPNGLVIYISPLKALINDQFGRLEPLCDALELPVWPWHGDISSSSKSRFLKLPSGILLITPESLEALLCNKGFSAPVLFSNLKYIVVDELHAFIGSERGKQLQSLMHRIELAANRNVPRIGLSATLGDMRLAAYFLRPHSEDKVEIIESKSEGGELKLVVKGFIEMEPKKDFDEEISESQATFSITTHLFKTLIGSNNLVFPNSRSKVEHYTYGLQKLCEENGRPNEFWPHHGNLSKEIREETESALKNKERHATAVCTNTLELGIDIGAVKSIAQIGSPPSVASMRQRLGRSGRRKGEPAILRAYAVELELTERSHVLTQLREGIFELTAMISLLLEGWFEPPRAHGQHLSTFVQQLLSLIAQRGGITAADAYRTLCNTGPFESVSKSDFIELLSHLGATEILQQESSGVLLHGPLGSKLVNHYSFYAAFSSEEEFRVVAGSKTLGSIPVSSAISVGDFILFAAKTWRVDEVDDESKSIFVTHHKTGKAPPFNSPGGATHDRVRQRMQELYESSQELTFLDETAKRLTTEGRNAYLRFSLGTNLFVSAGSSHLFFTWLGDAKNEALAMMLRTKGLSVSLVGPALEIYGDENSADDAIAYLKGIAALPAPSANTLLAEAHNLTQEKWDWTLPERLLQNSFASLKLDIEGAHEWLKTQPFFVPSAVSSQPAGVSL